MKKILVVLIILMLAYLVLKNISHSEAAIGSATLSWKSVDDANLTGYRIYYGTQKRSGNCPPAGYDLKKDVGNVTKYELDNLNDKKMYYFSVVSYNKDGKESCFSEEMQKKVRVSFFDKVKILFYK